MGRRRPLGVGRLTGTDAWARPFCQALRAHPIGIIGRSRAVSIDYCHRELHNLESLPIDGFEVSCFR